MGNHQEQGRGNAFFFTLILLLGLILAHSSSAYMIFRVGDDDGWTNNANGNDYTKWAAEKVFSVGDMLVFAYSAANHTVLQTSSQDAFEKCDIAADDAKIWSSDGSSSTNVLLSAPGTTYFLCTAWEGSHCRSGMKFGINVVGNPSGSAIPPTTETPSGSSTSPAPVSDSAPVLNPGSSWGSPATPSDSPPSTIIGTKPSSEDSTSQAPSRSSRLAAIVVIVGVFFVLKAVD